MITRIIESFQVAARVGSVAISSRFYRPPARSSNSPHLLIVCWGFPPDTTTGAQLPAFFARHAARTGWRVTVVCAPMLAKPPEAGFRALGMIPKEVRVVRARGRMDEEVQFHPQFPYRFSPGIDGGFGEYVGLMSAAVGALDADPPTHVMASGPAFLSFLVAARLARRYHARLCLQYRDEWTVMRPPFVSTQKGDVEQERQCLEAADLVWFVNQGQRDAYLKAFPLLRDKRCLVVPHGWDPDVLAEVRTGTDHLAAFKGKMVIAFTGRSTPAIPIEPFLRDLSVVLDQDPTLRRSLVFHMTGNQLPETLAALATLNARHPGTTHVQVSVPQATAMEIMREATALLLLNNTTYPGVVPLKTSDYMPSGSPILVVGTRGGAAATVRDTGAGLVVKEGDAAALAEAIGTIAQAPRERWSTPERARWCEEHSRASLSDRVLSEMLRDTP